VGSLQVFVEAEHAGVQAAAGQRAGDKADGLPNRGRLQQERFHGAKCSADPAPSMLCSTASIWARELKSLDT
jgi:hypothetical protein